MRAVVQVHVYELGGTTHAAESRFAYCFRLADKGHHRAVGGLAGVHVQQPDAFYAAYSVGYSIDNVTVTSLAEIRDTFYDSFHGIVVLAVYSSRSALITSCQGRPCTGSCAIKGSGSNSSTLCTPGLFHFPVRNIIAPMHAGTPVV